MSLLIKIYKSTILLVLVYIDDIIITDNLASTITFLISHLNATFSLKDLGRLNFFFGVEVAYFPSGFHLSQHKYACDLITKCDFQDSKHVYTLMVSSKLMSKFDGVSLDDPNKYHSIVSTLQYLTLTQPNISFAVNCLCQFLSQFIIVIGLLLNDLCTMSMALSIMVWS